MYLQVRLRMFRSLALGMNKCKPRNPSVEGGLAAMMNALLPHYGYMAAAEVPARPAWRRAVRADDANVACRQGGGGPGAGLTDDALENAHGIA
jgi:hypothetical protein